MDTILTLFEFQSHFYSEEDCFNYLVHQRWPNGFTCPRCKHTDAYKITTRKLFQCKKCRYQVSVTAGTVFHKLRHSLRTLFWAVYLVSTTKKGISALELKRKLGFKSYQTAWLLLHKIRKSMDSAHTIVINANVEVDETYVGGSSEGTRGRGAAHKKLVAVALETNGSYIGNVVFQHVQNASNDQLCTFVKEHVNKGVSVTTDGFKSYFSLKNDYKHIVNIRNNEDKNLRNIHIIISNLKSWLKGIFNRYPAKHIQCYLNEFVFRFNLRFQLENIFNILLGKCINSKTITYAELSG